MLCLHVKFVLVAYVVGNKDSRFWNTSKNRKLYREDYDLKNVYNYDIVTVQMSVQFVIC